MAARRKLAQTEETRAKIQAAMIINRLQACVSGEIVLDAQQVSCAKTLLNKVLPDLSSVTLAGDENRPLVHRIERTIVDPSDRDG